MLLVVVLVLGLLGVINWAISVWCGCFSQGRLPWAKAATSDPHGASSSGKRPGDKKKCTALCCCGWIFVLGLLLLTVFSYAVLADIYWWERRSGWSRFREILGFYPWEPWHEVMGLTTAERCRRLFLLLAGMGSLFLLVMGFALWRRSKKKSSKKKKRTRKQLLAIARSRRVTSLRPRASTRPASTTKLSPITAPGNKRNYSVVSSPFSPLPCSRCDKQKEVLASLLRDKDLLRFEKRKLEKLLKTHGILNPAVTARVLTDEDRKTIRGYLIDDEDSDRFQEVSHGRYGDVYRFVPSEGGEPVALKIMRTMDRDQMERTVTGLRRAHHPNLSKLFFYSLRKPPALVTELCHETVWELLQTDQLTDFVVKMKIIIDVALGMEHLHRCRVVHRDLKWENVMVSHPLSHPEWRAVVIDYGLVWVRGTSGATALPNEAGTTGYMAPELFTEGATFGFPADVFAFGIMMYELLMETDDAYGPKWPKDGDKASQVCAARLILDGLRPDVDRLMSSLPDEDTWLARMVACCWHADPLRRFTFAQIVHRIRVETQD